MADDERRAEIEAVCAALRAKDATHRGSPKCLNVAAEWLESDEGHDYLDRVRDARGDDDAPGTTCEQCGRRTMEPLLADDGDGEFCGRCAVEQAKAARSPQGEDARGDNEVGVALDAFWQVRDETQDNMQAMRAALAAARSPQDEDHGPREIAAWLRQEYEAEHRMDTLAGVARRIEEHYGY